MSLLVRPNDLDGLSDMTCQILRLYESGLISEHLLYIYGISGELPEREVYYRMSDQEKETYWDQKMSSKFGECWRNFFTELPTFLNKRDFFSHNWLVEGF